MCIYIIFVKQRSGIAYQCISCGLFVCQGMELPINASAPEFFAFVIRNHHVSLVFRCWVLFEFPPNLTSWFNWVSEA